MDLKQRITRRLLKPLGYLALLRKLLFLGLVMGGCVTPSVQPPSVVRRREGLYPR